MVEHSPQITASEAKATTTIKEVCLFRANVHSHGGSWLGGVGMGTYGPKVKQNAQKRKTMQNRVRSLEEDRFFERQMFLIRTCFFHF